MQLNTTGAFATALISAVIGFGLAFLIERKIKSQMQSKSQKVLLFVAMTSFGYGIMASLNELIGFPILGLQIRYEKLIGHVLANVLCLPIILLSIAKFIGQKNKAVGVDLVAPPSPASKNSFKYILLIAATISVSYFGYAVIKGDNLDATYDFYTKVDYKDCNSPFKSKPNFSLKFAFKKDTNDIFMTFELDEDGVKKQELLKLDNCSILDSKNWTCGGDITGGYQSPRYKFIDGIFGYDKGISTFGANCEVKFTKR
jgi:hypothetical protein